MKDQRSRAPASVDNIYRLDGRVPVGKAIPFGLQHVLAMFVANVTPVMLIASVAVYNGQAFTAIDTALLIQAAMLIAGIGTLIQLYPVWRIGSRLPVVMGLRFTFLSAMMTLAAKDYGLMIGAVIVGGCIEGLLGLTAKYWRRFVSPIVSACVVTTIGFSLLSTGISSFASSSVYPTGAWQNLLVAVITLAACLVYNSLAKGFWKQLYVLFGLIVGYIVSLFFGMVDFASMKETVSELGIIALPKLFDPLDDLTMILIGSMALGMVQIVTGMAISLIEKCKRKKFLDAFFEEITWWIVFIGIALLALGKGAAVLYVGCALVLLGPIVQGKGWGKLTGVFGSLYNHVTGYFGDILSYTRLMALMLAGSVIAQVFNMLAAMPGNVIAFIIISMLGNAMNFGLNLLGCYVHDLRLQCLEFFNKFYVDGGKPFRPMTLDTEYVDLQ